MLSGGHYLEMDKGEFALLDKAEDTKSALISLYMQYILIKVTTSLHKEDQCWVGMFLIVIVLKNAQDFSRNNFYRRIIKVDSP